MVEVTRDPITGQQFNDGSAEAEAAYAAAGGRNHASANGAHTIHQRESVLQLISKTTAVTINTNTTGDTHLNHIHVYKALTGTVTVQGFPDSDGAAKTITIPAGYVGSYPFEGAVNTVGPLIVTASNAADDDNVGVVWRSR